MPVRLNVVLCQAAHVSAADQQKQTDAVMSLLGRPGLDVHLISGLAADEIQDTDRLVLQSLERDFAIAHHLPAQQTLAELAELGVVGRRAAHRDDPDPPAAQGRRIFCLCYGDYADGQALHNALDAILQSQQVVTVPLSLAPGKMNGKPAKPASPPPTTPAATPPPAKKSPTKARPNASAASPPKLSDNQAPAPQPRQPPAVPDALDRLVDDLNEQDL